MTDLEPVDVARIVKDWLKSSLAEMFPSLTVALELPSDWALGSDPVLVVEDDGDPLGMWPAATSPTIRVTSWTSGRTRLYVNVAMPRLLSARIPGLRLLRGTGFLDARDEKTGGDLSSFTVRARARTTPSQ